MLKQRRTGIILLAIIALFGGLATGRDLFFNITYLLVILLLLSFAWAWSNINWLHLSRITRNRRTQVGRPLEERFQVRNTGIIPKLWLEVLDFSTLPGHHTSRVVNALGSKGRFSWRTTTVCLARGRYRLGPLQISTSDPFGLFPLKKSFEATTNVVVYPLTVDVHGFALPLGILPGGDALRRRTHYVTTNAAGVRDYAPGDSYGRIHWPSSARRDRLIVKEFELDPLSDIWVIADMDQSVHIAGQVEETIDSPASWLNNPFEQIQQKEGYSLPESTEEYTVAAAASLAQYFLRVDRAVGLIVYGQTHEIIQPDRGERQLNRILETLAVIRAQGTVPVEDVIESESPHFPRGGTILVATPSTREELAKGIQLLDRRGLRVVTILIDPLSFGGAESASKLASLMQGSSQLSYIVKSGDNLTAALSKPTAVPRGGLVYR